jgi:hypothetical protein
MEAKLFTGSFASQSTSGMRLIAMAVAFVDALAQKY